MSERVFTFGRGSSLVGILTEPSRPRRNSPALLMWNVGVNHRVGPLRFNVDLARALAEVGFTSLRFDISGLGDSAVRQDARAEHERAAADVREAMSALQSRNIASSFGLVGFCSSVDAAHAVASDPSVRGAVFIEGYTFRTRGFRSPIVAPLLRRQPLGALGTSSTAQLFRCDRGTRRADFGRPSLRS